MKGRGEDGEKWMRCKISQIMVAFLVFRFSVDTLQRSIEINVYQCQSSVKTFVLDNADSHPRPALLLL